MKVYKKENVYEATMKRLDIMFEHFDNLYFSVSGGKDSSIMLQLAIRKAKEHNKKLNVLYIDLEAQYRLTIEHVTELIAETEDVLDRWYWIALPISMRNAVSAIQPRWTCWDKRDAMRWVRPMPKNKWVINEDNCPWKWFYYGMPFREFILHFARQFNEERGGTTAVGIAIRSDESLNRFRTIISESKERFNDYGWTTRVHINLERLNVYNCFPLYDWRTEDDWTAVAKFDLKFNKVYELMYKNGLSIHEQRLCQPYGDDQRRGLDQFRAIEPDTWEKVLRRVEGVNFGNIYCRTSLLGNIKSEKPEYMTWQEYVVFLLESLGLYAPEVRDHYYSKIKKFMIWWEKQIGIKTNNIPEDKWVVPEYPQAPYWKRIARAIEKNDFWMSRLSFSETKSDVEKLFNLKKKYADLIGPGTQSTDKNLRRIVEGLK